MKTLDEVEPRKEVNATNTPGDASNMFIIFAGFVLLETLTVADLISRSP